MPGVPARDLLSRVRDTNAKFNQWLASRELEPCVEARSPDLQRESGQ